MPAYPSASSFAVEDDGGSVASMASLASKDSQVRQQSVAAAPLVSPQGFRACYVSRCNALLRHECAMQRFFLRLDLCFFCAVGGRHVLERASKPFGMNATLVPSPASRSQVPTRVSAVEGHGICQFEFLVALTVVVLCTGDCRTQQLPS